MRRNPVPPTARPGRSPEKLGVFRVWATLIASLGALACLASWQKILVTSVLGPWHATVASSVGPAIFALIAAGYVPLAAPSLPWYSAVASCLVLATRYLLQFWHGIVLSPALELHSRSPGVWELCLRGAVLCALACGPACLLLSAATWQPGSLAVPGSNKGGAGAAVRRAALALLCLIAPTMGRWTTRFPDPARALPVAVALLSTLSFWLLGGASTSRHRSLLRAAPLVVLAAWAMSGGGSPRLPAAGGLPAHWRVLSQSRLPLDGTLLAVVEGTVPGHPTLRSAGG